MKLQVVSDIHTEDHADLGVEWATMLPVGDCDALIVAGDFGNVPECFPTMRKLCRRFPQVIFVAGNHEYWNSGFTRVNDSLTKFDAEVENFTWLDCDVADVGGVRILGTTLWYPRTGDTVAMEHQFPDFLRIADPQRIYDENRRAVEFLTDEVLPGDVVVTHHLPTQECVSPRWRGNAFTPFFVCELRALITMRAPKLWIHGHTHDSRDINVGKTRIVCNPHGHPMRDLNGMFDTCKLVECGGPS